jgi:multiple sugar transport system permease protein
MYNRAAAASMIMFLISAILAGILFYVMRDRDASRLKKIEKQKYRKAAIAAREGGVTHGK